MIELQYSNGDVFIFNAQDWVTLRRTHRIVGHTTESTNFIPALPAKLCLEEVLLLMDNKIATVIESLHSVDEISTQSYNDFEKDLVVEEQLLHRKKRQIQLDGMIDKIVAGKRHRGDERSVDDILQEELDKSSKIPQEHVIWPTLLTPLTDPSNAREISKDELMKHTSVLKYKVFKDLWTKGYHITLGHKFGGDFLVYLGDPISYHAIFIVKCVEDPNASIHSSEIVAFGRLGTSVKKRAVLASLNEDNQDLLYITINWIDA